MILNIYLYIYALHYIYLKIAYSTVQSVDLKTYMNNEDAEYEVHISCKNFLFIQFTIFSEKIAHDVFESLKKLINISKFYFDALLLNYL